MVDPELLTALDAFIARPQRRTFDDGHIGGLQIQEYWHADVLPAGSEQQLSFYRAEATAFDSMDAFASAVFLFSCADDITYADRSIIDVSDTLTEIAPLSFADEWQCHAAKVREAPPISVDMLLNAWSITDEWNDKLFVAGGTSHLFGLNWATSA